MVLSYYKFMAIKSTNMSQGMSQWAITGAALSIFDAPKNKVRRTWRRKKQKETYRSMCPLMIDVDECSLHIGENFDLILELLTDIVRLP